MDERFVMVWITVPSEEEGERIAKALVQEQLAACANVIPQVRSFFIWENTFSCEKEVLLILKTKASLFPDLERRVREMHSYEVPEIIATPIEMGFQAYLEWVSQNTKKKGNA